MKLVEISAFKYRTIDARFVVYSEVTGHGARRSRRWRAIDLSTEGTPEVADGSRLAMVVARLDRYVQGHRQ